MVVERNLVIHNGHGRAKRGEAFHWITGGIFLYSDRLEDVRPVDLGPVTREPLARRVEAIGVQVQQREPRPPRREAAPVEEISGADSGVKVVRSDVPVVEREKTLRGAAPDEAVREAQDEQVVRRQHCFRVDGLARRNLFGHVSPMLSLVTSTAASSTAPRCSARSA